MVTRWRASHPVDEARWSGGGVTVDHGSAACHVSTGFFWGGPGVPGGCCVLAMACRPCGVVEVYCSDDASINDSGWTARAVVARTGRAGAGGSTSDKNGDAMRRGRGAELRNADAELL